MVVVWYYLCRYARTHTLHRVPSERTTSRRQCLFCRRAGQGAEPEGERAGLKALHHVSRSNACYCFNFHRCFVYSSISLFYLLVLLVVVVVVGGEDGYGATVEASDSFQFQSSELRGLGSGHVQTRLQHS